MKNIIIVFFLALCLSGCSKNLYVIDYQNKEYIKKDYDLYINNVRVFESNDEHDGILYEVFDDDFIIITEFPVLDDMAYGPQYRGKHKIYIIEIDNLGKIYTTNLSGIFGEQIKKININKKTITIKNKEDKRVSFNMQLIGNVTN